MKKIGAFFALSILILSSAFLFAGCDWFKSSTPNAIYSIDVTQSVGGYVFVDKSVAEKGEEVTITVLVDDNYKLDFLTYNSVKVDGFTFQMPERNVIVTAHFSIVEEDPAPEAP